MKRTKRKLVARKRKAGAVVAAGKDGFAAGEGEASASVATGVCGTALGNYGDAHARAAVATGLFGYAVVRGKHGGAMATNARGFATAVSPESAAMATGASGVARALAAGAVALASDRDGMVSGEEGSGIVAVERDENGNIMSIASGIVGQGGIKPHTWYACKDGQLVEAK